MIQRTKAGLPVFEQVGFHENGAPYLAPGKLPLDSTDEFWGGQKMGDVLKSKLVAAAERGVMEKARAEGLQKSFTTAGVAAGGGQSNLYALCDAVELGYGIYGVPYDFIDALLNFFGPTVVRDDREFRIPIVDWRGVFNSTASGAVQSLVCAPSFQARRGAVGKQTIDYCVDPDRAYRVTVDRNALSDFQRECFQQPLYNLWGQMIDPMNMEGLADFLLMEGMKRLMAVKSLTGSYSAAGNNWDGTAVKESTGLLKFFDDFPTRHPELDDAPASDLLPQTIALPACPSENATAAEIQTYYEEVGYAIDSFIDSVEQRVANLGGGAMVADEDRIVIMNWEDAKCLQYGQACTQPCGGVFLNVNVDPGRVSEARMQLYQDYRKRLTMGKYGAGVIITPSGRIIDIWANPNFSYADLLGGSAVLPRGSIYLFHRGWRGGYSPSQFALRPIAVQWTRWIENLRATSAVPNQYQLLLNGTALRVNPVNGCDNPALLFNIDWGFSNAPWMHAKFTGFCPCPLTGTPTSFPAMPTVAAPVRCTPN